jgi:hypothetical protein
MKKFSFFLLILLLTRVGTSYAAPNDGTTLDFQNFFLGNSANPNVNVNQVLALLVGPEGQPGPAGVAGRDGFVGMNGQDGKDGLPGAPGPVGPQGADGPAGASVVAVVLNVGDPDCANGGSKFISGDGSTAFACNGAAGATGAPGATGAQGPQGLQGLQGEPGEGVVVDTSADGLALVAEECENGGRAYRDGDGNLSSVCNGTGGTGGGGSLSQGQISVSSCDDDADLVPIYEYKKYDGNKREFILEGFKLAGLNYKCFGIGYRAELRFNIQDPANDSDTSPPNLLGAEYAKGDDFICRFTVDTGNSLNEDAKDKIRISEGDAYAPTDTDEVDLIFKLQQSASVNENQVFVVPSCSKNTVTIPDIFDFLISSRDLGDQVSVQFTR